MRRSDDSGDFSAALKTAIGTIAREPVMAPVDGSSTSSSATSGSSTERRPVSLVSFTVEPLKNQRSAEYVRIKVLKDEGKKYGDISITHVPLLTNLEKIKARVTKPDGTVVPFNGKVYDKVVVKAGGVRVVSKTFTLPDVQAGAILEYSYERGEGESEQRAADHFAAFFRTSCS